MVNELPVAFLRSTAALFGPERFGRFMSAMAEEPPVSIRVNPLKVKCAEPVSDGERVPWCPWGYYLPRRPNFTFDPLFHAGCYYVQEAASQFVTAAAALRRILPGDGSPAFVLDLCAAPGGKSTALLSALPGDCLLVSNEPVRQRASVLAENMQKWGHPNCAVTSCQARDFVRAGLEGVFDMIVCDVPCSGEGMFRKDPASVGEWSEDGVSRCRRLQRRIVGDVWPCLRPGGLMVYSTCTYNVHENEENVKWLQEQTGAEVTAIPVQGEWGVVPSLLQGFDAPVCRFIPGMTRSEGLFMAVLRKTDGGKGTRLRARQVGERIAAMALERRKDTPGAGRKGGPLPAEALSAALDPGRHPTAELPYHTAIAYLRREAVVLPAGTPAGHVIVTFGGHALGFVKNIGPRANNLLPREWAIKSSHVPEAYGRVLREGA